MVDRAEQASGTSVPDFHLPASTGHTLQLDSFLGKTRVVFVFLDHLSERHRRLLGEIDARLKEFGSQRAQVLVVMPLSARDTSQMAEELDLAVPVLADANGAMTRDFGADSSGTVHHPVAILADREGAVIRRFDALDEHDQVAEIVDVLLDALSQDAPGEIPTVPDRIGSDDEFYARIVDEARIPEEEAPVLVQAFLSAISPFLGEEARAVVSELAPKGLEIPTAENEPNGAVEDLLLATIEESSIASGRPVEHARVVAEALRSRADAGQVGRLEAAVEDEDVLGLFETYRGELTAHHRLDGVSELSGENSDLGREQRS
jgi:peroxiredoxin